MRDILLLERQGCHLQVNIESDRFIERLYFGEQIEVINKR
jgi:hypothetical protein